MFTPSRYQLAIFDFVKNGQGHGLVDAVPGSGKKASLIEAATFLPPNCKGTFLAFKESP